MMARLKRVKKFYEGCRIRTAAADVEDPALVALYHSNEPGNNVGDIGHVVKAFTLEPEMKNRMDQSISAVERVQNKMVAVNAGVR